MDWRLYLSAAAMIFLSEMGDKTQLTTIFIALNKPQYRWIVWLGSAAALTTASFCEVIIGSTLSRYLKPKQIRIGSACLFCLMGSLLLLGII